MSNQIAMPSDPREQALPKWARSLIDRLRQQINNERWIRDKNHAEPNESSIVVVGGSYQERGAVGFGDVSVAFKLNDDASSEPGMDGWIVAMVRDGKLDVSACGSSILVSPRSSNAILVSEARR